MTEDEFQQGLTLLDSPVHFASLVAIAALGGDARLNPERRDAVLYVLRPRTADPDEVLRNATLREVWRLEALSR